MGRVEVRSAEDKVLDNVMNRVVVFDTICAEYVVVLKRPMVLDAETEMDTFTDAAPTFDHLVVVETWTGFEIAEGSAVPGKLYKSTWKETGLNLLSE